MGRSIIKVTSGRKRVSPKKRREGRCNRVQKAQVKRVEDGEKECSKGRGWEGRQGGGGQGEEDKLIQFKSMPWALSYPKFLL